MSDQDEKHKLSLLVLQNEMRDLKTSVHHFQAENIDLRTQVSSIATIKHVIEHDFSCSVKLCRSLNGIFS